MVSCVRQKGGGMKRPARILIVESRYYADIADALIEGAEREIGKAGAQSERVVVFDLRTSRGG